MQPARAEAMTAPGFAAATARLEAWLSARRPGAAVDPAALALAQALRRRGAAQDAAVQAALAPRLDAAVDALDRAPAGAVPPPPDRPPSALQPLLAQLAARGAGGGELPAVARLRPALARWRVAQQLARAQARRPENPGPLNGEHLLLRALQQLQQHAPALLGAFVTQAETLLWLDGARGADVPPSRQGPRRTAAAPRRDNPGA